MQDQTPAARGTNGLLVPLPASTVWLDPSAKSVGMGAEEVREEDDAGMDAAATKMPNAASMIPSSSSSCGSSGHSGPTPTAVEAGRVIARGRRWPDGCALPALAVRAGRRCRSCALYVNPAPLPFPLSESW